MAAALIQTGNFVSEAICIAPEQISAANVTPEQPVHELTQVHRTAMLDGSI